MPRDPRIDPQAGDVLNLIGWDIEVVCVMDDTVDYWQRGGWVVPSVLLTKPLTEWRDQMGKHARLR